MGKPKGKASKKARKIAQKKGLSVDPASPEYSCDDLLMKADELVDTYQYDLAMKFCQRALEIDQDHPKALETAAGIVLEGGDVENARHFLGRAVTVDPDQGHSKYLTLAQLFTGREALGLYRKGIEIMQKALLNEASSSEASSTVSSLPRELSNAFCSVAELFMTDLCDETEAEEECKNAIQQSIDADTTNPEATQTKARYLIIREMFEEAKVAMNESLSLWLPKYQMLRENKLDVGEFDPVEVCPLLYTTRITTAQMLIELEMWEEATKVLDGLTEEDDEVVQTWYLLGWINYLRANEPDGDKIYNGNARFYLKKAQRVNKVNPTEDEEMVKHINSLLTELGPGEDDEDNEGEVEGKFNAEDWESCSEDETEDQMDT